MWSHRRFWPSTRGESQLSLKKLQPTRSYQILSKLSKLEHNSFLYTMHPIPMFSYFWFCPTKSFMFILSALGSWFPLTSRSSNSRWWSESDSHSPKLTHYTFSSKITSYIQMVSSMSNSYTTHFSIYIS